MPVTVRLVVCVALLVGLPCVETAPRAAATPVVALAEIADQGLLGSWLDRDEGRSGFLALGRHLVILDLADAPRRSGSPVSVQGEPGLGAAVIELGDGLRLIVQRGDRIRQRPVPGGSMLEFAEILTVQVLIAEAGGERLLARRDLVSAASERAALRYALLNPVPTRSAPEPARPAEPDAVLLAGAGDRQSHAGELIRLRGGRATTATLAAAYGRQQAEALRQAAQLLAAGAAGDDATRQACVAGAARSEAQARRYAELVAAWLDAVKA
jgi:hypothetical protein